MVARNDAVGVARSGSTRRAVRVGECRTALELVELLRPIASKVRRGKTLDGDELVKLDKGGRRLAPSDPIADDIRSHGVEFPPPRLQVPEPRKKPRVGPPPPPHLVQRPPTVLRHSPMAPCQSRDCGMGLKLFTAGYTIGGGERRRCGDCHEQDLLLAKARHARWEATHTIPAEAATDGTAATSADFEREAAEDFEQAPEPIARVKDLGEMVAGWDEQGRPLSPVIEELKLPPESREAMQRQIDRYLHLAGKPGKEIRPFPAGGIP